MLNILPLSPHISMHTQYIVVLYIDVVGLSVG